jgi:hypothetical protein
MGMYTELIFGCALRKDTPKVAINALRWMCGDIEKPDALPVHEFFEEESCSDLFKFSSHSFAVSEPHFRMWYDNISGDWRVSVRANGKNYCNEIELFLDWVKKYISSGSGTREFFAIVCFEEQEEPTIYYLED